MPYPQLAPAQAIALPVPSQDVRNQMLALDRTEANHVDAIAKLACMNRVEAPPAPHLARLQFPFTTVAWNVERCHVLEPSAALLAEQKADLVLLSEMDNGMSRTGQRHTTREVAAHLDMAYAYGVEFLELELGTGVMLPYCKDPQNDKGFHGNAILARTALQMPTMLRLPDQLFWFNPQAKAARVGTRCAIMAVIATEQGPLCAVSVHLENLGDTAHRARQVEAILDAIEETYGEMPVILGGDLNTGLANGGDFEKEELFELARQRGYVRHSGEIDQMTTRPSRFSQNPQGLRFKLDWFLTRGVKVGQSSIIPSLGPDDAVLSDHDMIRIEIEGLE